MTDIISKLQGYLTSQDELSPGEKVIRETDLDFLADSLSELISKDGWRKVSDELPKVASKPYCIVVRDDDGRVQLEWILVGYDEGVISFLLDKYVEWKPID